MTLIEILPIALIGGIAGFAISLYSSRMHIRLSNPDYLSNRYESLIRENERQSQCIVELKRENRELEMSRGNAIHTLQRLGFDVDEHYLSKPLGNDAYLIFLLEDLIAKSIQIDLSKVTDESVSTDSYGFPFGEAALRPFVFNHLKERLGYSSSLIIDDESKEHDSDD